MMVPGRRWSGNLVLLPTTPIEQEIDYISPRTPFVAILPKSAGLYPAQEFTQLQLNLGVWALPADATVVQVTLVKFRGFMIPPNQAAIDAGTVSLGTPRFELFLEQYEQVDSVTNLLTPYPATIEITAPAPTMAYNGETYSLAGQQAVPNGPGAGGGAFSFPLCDDFFGFLVTSDDDGGGAAGVYTMNVTLGAA